MIGALMANLLFSTTAYYLVLGYSICSLGFFLVRCIDTSVQQ